MKCINLGLDFFPKNFTTLLVLTFPILRDSPEHAFYKLKLINSHFNKCNNLEKTNPLKLIGILITISRENLSV